jgi:SNF2 family DNA or RNA helicase
VQIGVFLNALYDNGMIDKALVVLPASLIANWQVELAKWAPHVPLLVYHGSVAQRRRALSALDDDGGLCLTTYGIVIDSQHHYHYTDTHTYNTSFTSPSIYF